MMLIPLVKEVSDFATGQFGHIPFVLQIVSDIVHLMNDKWLSSHLSYNQQQVSDIVHLWKAV